MRQAEFSRETLETRITGSLTLEGGEIRVKTGIGFFDHMLTAFARHGGFGLVLTAAGDLEVDGHHTVEDTGIVLGTLLRAALGDKSGIARYGSFFVPMDEALGFAAADISGRAYLVWDAAFLESRAGDFDLCLAEEFWRAFCMNAGITLHLRLLYGKNGHHGCEAIFKAAGHALRQAVTPVQGGVLSTKGVL